MTEMTPVEALFFAALQKPPPERAAYLERACAGDVELRQRVGRLLAAHPQVGNFLEAPAAGLTSPCDPPHAPTAGHAGPPQEVGAVLAGRYQLLEALGEGGMGRVFLAQQTEPVQRLVAVKLIKAGMDSRQVLARFEAERQALALMDHPHIAKVFDAGTTPDGRPFFVMELVKGVPLTRYCDEQRLTPRQRLELFIPVCQAIQHAHQKGIIHRDVKPSNVLVALYDDKPVVKVIDFGVAKATGPSLTEQTAPTGFGSVVGTVEYMSPEQASFNPLDVDTRSDIYSLGVLLYELLTGSPPFGHRELEQAGLLEMLRVIREQEPQRPSTRLSTAEGLPALAANRGTDPARLTRLVCGELDWIVLKALEKDRSRRYETANAFALDIQRYLHDEPVLAGPPSATYRLRKFVRRNKGPVLAAAAVLVALVVGIIGSTLGLIEARRQEGHALAAADKETKARAAEAAQRQLAQDNERKANAEKDRAEKAAAREKEARQAALKRLGQIEKANAILGSIFKDLDPRAGEKEGIPLQALLGQRLDRATEELEGEAVGDPLAVAKLQMILGESQQGLGYPDKAITLFRRARATYTALRGPKHHETLASMSNLADAYRDAGLLDLAVPLFEETLKRIQAQLGPEHHDTVATMCNLAYAYRAAGKFELALSLLEEAFKVLQAQRGPEHPSTLTCMNNVAAAYSAVGRPEVALPLYKEALRLRKANLGPEHPDTLMSMGNLATAYYDAGKLDLALPLFKETLRLRRARLGPEHPHTLTSMGELARAYQADRKLDLALPLYEETVKLMKARLGPEHRDTLRVMNNLAGAYQAAGKLDLALSLYEETLRLHKDTLGPEHPHTLTCMNNVISAYQAAGKLDLTLSLYEELFKLTRARLGPEHPDTLRSMNNLAAAYKDAGRLDLALPLGEETLKLTRARLGPKHPHTLISMNNLASAYYAAGQLDLARPLFEETLKLMKTKLGLEHPDTLTCMNNLAHVYVHACRYADAEPLLVAWIGKQQPRLAIDHLRLAFNLNVLGACRVRLKKYAEAEAPLRDSLAIYLKKLPNAVVRYDTESLLGAALAGQKKYADAEPLLVSGARELMAHAANLSPGHRRLMLAAVGRAMEFYEARDRPDDAARWRKELEALRQGDKKVRDEKMK